MDKILYFEKKLPLILLSIVTVYNAKINLIRNNCIDCLSYCAIYNYLSVDFATKFVSVHKSLFRMN